jgi:hypothetical protein
MQGPSHLDLARTLADEHLRHTNAHRLNQPRPEAATDKLRSWVGHRLIGIGERLATRPTDLQLKVSTGPPCP